MSNVRRPVPRPELLLFDLGGVLIDNVAFERLNATAGITMAESEVKTKWLTSPTVRAFELGAMSPESFAQAFVAEWRLPAEPASFLADFASWPKGFYPGALELLAGLRREFRVACLSNSNALHWQRFDSLGEHFDVALSSHLLKAIKPDPLCFERALEECATTAGNVAFFDDSPENVVAAKEFGLQAFHVSGLAEVKGTLVRAGWLR